VISRAGASAAVIALCVFAMRGSAQSAPASQRPVQFTIRTIAGDSIRVGAREPATLIAVFATWCRSCKDEVPEINALSADFASRGVRVVAVDIEQITEDGARRWLAGRGATYAAGLDESGAIARALGVVGVPEFHLVATDGRVIFSRRGPLGSAMPALRSAVATLAPSGR
jgi:cytochrome c biogenesis protein CcmG/thiol:disulfide interchange protein DsbE